jgi:predicted nucleic acid-binding Zn ribbon protein
VLKRHHLDRVIAAQKAVSVWPEVAGERTAQHTKAVEVEGSVLVVTADSEAWLTQLRFLKSQLLRKLSVHVGKDLVSDIRFVLGRGKMSDSA